MAVEVRDQNVQPLDANRIKSGVCGFPIRDTALAFAKDARKIITENGLKLKLIAVWMYFWSMRTFYVWNRLV